MTINSVFIVNIIGPYDTSTTVWESYGAALYHAVFTFAGPFEAVNPEPFEHEFNDAMFTVTITPATIYPTDAK